MTQTIAEPQETAPAGWEGILEPGERILWQGRPDTVIEWSNILSIQGVFGLFFAAFAVLWIMTAGAMGAGGMSSPIDLFFPLFGLPFLATGLWIMVGHIIWDARMRSRTWYTLTDRTAFVATLAGGSRKLETWPLHGEMNLSLEDGSPGTVWFEKRVFRDPGGYSGSGTSRRYRPPRTTVTPVGFRRIADARRVHRLLLDRVAALRAAEAADAPLA